MADLGDEINEMCGWREILALGSEYTVLAPTRWTDYVPAHIPSLPGRCIACLEVSSRRVRRLLVVKHPGRFCARVSLRLGRLQRSW
jgi:hypothetical protein